MTAENISEDGSVAVFHFPESLVRETRSTYFVSNKNHGYNIPEVEYTLGQDGGNVFEQERAGEMALRRLFLHTGTSLIRIEAGKEPTLQMHICGSIIRPLVYTNTYNDEHVLSVELLSNSKIVGTVNYDRAAGTCRGVAEIDWKAYSNTKVTLAEPYVLDSVASADAAKGLYLPVAAGNYEG